MPKKTKEAQVHIPWRMDIADAVQDLVWSPDGRWLVCGCQDNSQRCWTWPSAESCPMSGYSAKLRTLAWDHHSRWLATGDREVVTAWDFSQGVPMGQMPRDLEAMTDRVLDLAFQPGGDGLAAGDQSGHLMIWKTTDPDFQLFWQGELRDGFQRLVWHPHQCRLAVSGILELHYARAQKLRL